MPGDVRMLVEHLAKNLVEAPDAVFVEENPLDGGTEIELEVAVHIPIDRASRPKLERTKAIGKLDRI